MAKGNGLGYVCGQPFPAGWPSERPRVRPNACPSKTMQEAFAWPTVAKRNLAGILSNLDPGVKPLIATGKCLKVSSHFSGMCTQSRGAMILEAHGFGVTFQHVWGSFAVVLEG